MCSGLQRRIQLLQDFEMPTASSRIHISPDGQYIMASGKCSHCCPSQGTYFLLLVVSDVVKPILSPMKMVFLTKTCSRGVRFGNVIRCKLTPGCECQGPRVSFYNKLLLMLAYVHSIHDFGPRLPVCLASFGLEYFFLCLFCEGVYKPRVRCYDVNQLSMKFERCMDSEGKPTCREKNFLVPLDIELTKEKGGSTYMACVHTWFARVFVCYCGHSFVLAILFQLLKRLLLRCMLNRWRQNVSSMHFECLCRPSEVCVTFELVL